MSGNLLHVDNVSRTFSVGGLFSRGRVHAVRSISFAIERDRAQIFTIIGESGSGKSTLARMILGMDKPSSGTIHCDGENLAATRSEAQKLAFMAKVQPIFQNPFEAFNPLRPVDAYLHATARRFRGVTDRQELDRIVDENLTRVGLTLGEVRSRFPHELSGGQLQRIAVARALIPGPALLVADEPVSMVDASLRMSIVNLFKTLRDEMGVSIIYITHDLATAYYISDHVMIMRNGQMVESGPAQATLDNPQDPYSIQLRAAVLPPDPRQRDTLFARPPV